jgi:hypothetical protein
MRLGDYIICISMALNFLALVAYAWQGHWRNAVYFFGAFVINASLVGMR